jgi:hypothetical protein
MIVTSSLLVESIVALLSCAILLVLLITRAPPPPIKLSQSPKEGTPRSGPSRERPIKRRAFRISSISPDVTEGELRTYLKDLLEDCAPDDLIVSLAPYSYGNEQIATVTFTRRELSPFRECKTDERLYFQSDRMKSRIIVDCEFQGVTPLYSAREPTVEWVEVSLVRSYQKLADHGMCSIVAVTGLAGHAFGSWKSRTQDHQMWLRDFLPVDLRDANVRILTFGYNSALKESTSTSSLQDFSRQLLDGVNSVRADADKARTRISL